ncbi:MAG: hypothetical protein HZC29_00665 [Thaumarchaeota archaeon]|nr:hypothetical protein [Nitrososphaerota archaeon]
MKTIPQNVREPGMMLSDPNGPIKICEIKLNSAVSFNYPDPDRYKNRDPFEQFILIRLPDYLGGAANDASAFRAYSAIDPTSHCLVRYWPQEGRRQIEDPCSGSMYEPVFGHATIISGHSVLVSKNLALPYLTLSDENGFLYAEPPVWTEDKNGAIGIGRTISEEELRQVSQFATSREKQFHNALEKFAIPEMFSTGYKLDHIGDDGVRTKLAEYFYNDSSIMIFYQYCNCTEFERQEMTRTNSQFLTVDDVSVYAYPKTVLDYTNQVYDEYVFVFHYDGYRISIHTEQKLDAGISLVKEFLDFERNAKMDK